MSALEATAPPTSPVATPLRLIIVEDDIAIYQTLKSLLQLRFPEILLVGHCETVREVASLVEALAPDILLMDIELKDGTAFEGLASVTRRSFDTIVMTAQRHIHFAQEAIRLGASDYLLKPFDTDDVIRAIENVVKQRLEAQLALQAPSTHRTSGSHQELHREPHREFHREPHREMHHERRVILTTNDKTTHVIECNNIVRLEASGKHTFVHLWDHSKLLVLQTLEKTAELVPHDQFYRVHRSHVINLERLHYARNGFAFLTNGDRVDVSSRIWTQFLKDVREFS
jgi:two-component system LytT family response regulator